MKDKYSIVMFLFVVLLSMSFTSAGTQIIPDYGNSFEINDFQVNPNLTISDMIILCVQESCIIDDGEESSESSYYSHKWKTVTIRSHYDNEVALILRYDSMTNAEGTKTWDFLKLTTILPYEPNQACLDYNFQSSKGCEIISTHISPGDYNWKESVDTDLKYLKGLSLIDLSDEEIEEMSSLAQEGKGIHKFNEDWVKVKIYCSAVNISDTLISNPSEEDINNGWIEQCPAWGGGGEVSTILLPEKEYGIQEEVDLDEGEDEKEISFLNLVYWILGIMIFVVVIIILFLVFRKKRECEFKSN